MAAQARISERSPSDLEAELGAPCSGERLACTNGLSNSAEGDDPRLLGARRLEVRSGVHPVHSNSSFPPASGGISREVGPSDTLSVSHEEKVIRINGEPVRLTRTEFKLLLHLVERPFGWVTAGDLIRDVLGTHHRPDTPLVRVHVHAVRRKLAARARWLESDPHRLRGYRWVGPSPS